VGELGLACLLLYTVTSFVVGTRLIARARRSRGWPEFLMGVTYTAAPGLGYPLLITAPLWPTREASLGAVVVGELLIMTGCSAFMVFNAKVFRPTAGWAMSLAWVGVSVIVAGGCAVILAHVSTADAALAVERARGGTAAMLTALGAGYAWTAFEGLRYHRMMRRRIALGLAEPIVANRFLLWALAGIVATAWNTVSCTYLLAGANIGTHPVPLLATCLGGLVSAVLQVLIFMPPARYVRWIERDRAARALATA
jgi:hypothetical protein